MEILSQKSREALTRQLRIDEGNVLHVYQCSKNRTTIGNGRNLQDKGLSKQECDFLKLGTYDKNAVIAKLEVRGITQSECDYLLSNDIDEFSAELYNRIIWFKKLPKTAQNVLINMCLNLGFNRLSGFKKTLALIEKGSYKLASIEMLNSNWAIQVGDRAKRLSKILASC